MRFSRLLSREKNMTWHYRVLGGVLPSIGGVDFRIVSRLHKPSGFSQSPIVCANGFRLLGETSNASYVTGVNESAFLKRIGVSIKGGATVYNIGANIGYTALFLGQHFRNSRKDLLVIAFEPEPATFAILEKNVKLNEHLTVECVNSAVGDTDGLVGFSSSGAGDGSARIDDGGTQKVEVCTLDSFREKHDSSPDLLVIDVEGFGGKCLGGGRNVLAVERPKIALEVHSKQEYDESSTVLIDCGYVEKEMLRSIWGDHVFWEPR